MLRKKNIYWSIILLILCACCVHLCSSYKSEQQNVAHKSQNFHSSSSKIELSHLKKKKEFPENKSESLPANLAPPSEAKVSAQKEYIVDCPLNINEDESNELMALNDNVFSDQLDTNLPNELLGKILFSSDWIQLNKTIEEVQLSRSSMIKALYDYHLSHPSEKISYFRLLTWCTETQYSYCNDDFYQKVKQIDNDNGLAWLTVASLYLEKQNILAANNAFYQASLANTFSVYFFELIYLHHEILKKYVPLQANKLLNTGIGYAAATPSGFHKAINHCSKAIVDDHLTLEACLKIGNQMENNSDILIHSAMGIALQKIYYDKHEHTEKVDKIKNQSTKLISKVHQQQYNKATNLMFHDNELADQWVNYGLQHGEEKTIKYIIDEAIWRSKGENYHPCPIQ